MEINRLRLTRPSEKAREVAEKAVLRSSHSNGVLLDSVAREFDAFASDLREAVWAALARLDRYEDMSLNADIRAVATSYAPREEP